MTTQDESDTTTSTQIINGSTNDNESNNDENEKYIVLEPGDEGGITALEGEISNVEEEIEGSLVVCVLNLILSCHCHSL
jgi:hypothetical protein